MSRCRIVYFVKYPEPGKVKTRLAKTLGNKEAARIYRKLAEENFRTLQKLESTSIEICVMFDPPESESQIKMWLQNETCRYLAQQGADLGERLTHAFQSAFESGAAKALAVGSDTLNLDADILRKAVEMLATKDAVLGPAKDGGYYLIGLSRWVPFIFKNIPWSTPAVAGITLQRIKEKNLSYELLPELEDLDEAENFKTAFTKSGKGL